VKLLFDQNLSPRLVRRLADLFPNSTQVYLIHLDQALDLTVWEYSRDSDYALVTRDADFSELSLLQGFPPKIIWIRRGNCSTSDIESLLRSHSEDIELLDSDPTIGVIELI
jgi:predicted nuclease of predicted toxin-antitoxin system